MGEKDKHIAVFNNKEIRRKLIGNKWFFSVVDVVMALTESTDPNDYWYRLKKKRAGNQWNRVIDILSTTETQIRGWKGV